MEETMPSLFTSLRSSSHKPLSSKKELEWLIMQDRFIQIHTDDYRQMVNIDRKAADNKSETLLPSVHLSSSNPMVERSNTSANLPTGPCSTMIIRQASSWKTPWKRLSKAYYHGLLPHYQRQGIQNPPEICASPGCTLTETELHRLAITKAIKIYDELLNLNADRQCLDMTRLCGLAHDEKAYFNWDAEPLPLSPEEVTKFYQTVLKPEMEREKSWRRIEPTVLHRKAVEALPRRLRAAHPQGMQTARRRRKRVRRT